MKMPVAASLTRRVDDSPISLSPIVSNYWPQLDGLRGFASLLVLVNHSYLYVVNNPIVSHLVGFGWCGVDLFFVLSGFLIGTRLQRDRSHPRFFSSFYLSRICRICPLYFLLVIVVFACLKLSRTDLRIPMWAYLIFSQNLWHWQAEIATKYLGPTWTLAIEENFYFLLPFMVRNFKKAHLISFCLVAAVLLPCVRGFLCYLYHRPELLIDTLRPEGLCLGVLASIMVSTNKVDLLFKRAVSAFIFGPAAVIVLLTMVLSDHSFGYYVFKSVLGYSAVAIFHMYTLLFVLRYPAGRLAGSLQIRPLKKLARVSYGVYLLQTPLARVGHDLASRFLHQDAYTSGWFMSGCAILSIMAAHFSWRWLEAPAIAFGRRNGAASPA